MFYGGAVHASGVLVESGDLVSCIGDVSFCALLEDVEL